MSVNLARVAGDSMSPALRHDDYVVIGKGPLSRYHPGQIVMVRHPRFGTIIKRVREVQGRRYLLGGDDPCSTSSKRLGWVHHDSIVGKVLLHVASPVS